MVYSKCNVLIIDKECQELAKSTGLVIPAKNIFFADNFGSIISRTEDGEEKPIGEVQILPSVMQVGIGACSALVDESHEVNARSM